VGTVDVEVDDVAVGVLVVVVLTGSLVVLVPDEELRVVVLVW
jgi:hypothetical protein